MKVKARLAKGLARFVNISFKRWSNQPIHYQDKAFKYLLDSARNTKFGKDHHFEGIETYDDFKKNVPIRDYEGLKEYVDLALLGQENILWPGKPIYFCETSGTTSI